MGDYCEGGAVVARWQQPTAMTMGRTDAKRHVVLGVPFYDRIEGKSVVAWDYAIDPNGPNRVERVLLGSSCLCDNFNQLFCHALNHPKATHFAMCHVDVRPLTVHWLDRMAEEYDASGADMLSVVLPIKDDRALTSTALEHMETGRVRRLTMGEVLACPVNFDAAGAGFPGWRIMVASGLWIVDLRKPCWSRQNVIKHGLWFETHCRLQMDPDGLLSPVWASEDWVFSRRLHAAGARPMASRCVKATHIGSYEYANDEDWGTEDADGEAPSFSWVDEPWAVSS